ncbi:thymidylate synthase [Leifsonia sp. NPDC014704]|uniref:thymidylate synthase n=1 Tax=Leifsonia sp. NPDC014704 TaxID=3364123 RepID=UPI0036F484B2
MLPTSNAGAELQLSVDATRHQPQEVDDVFAIEAASASVLWEKAWDEIARSGNPRSHRRGGYAEILHAVMALPDPRQRWVASRTPPVNPAFALAEVVWIIQGRKDSAFVTPWNNQLTQYAGSGPEFYGAYGERLRSRFGFDQLDRAARVLRANPEQRQVVLQIWDARTDLPSDDGHSRATDIPCNTSSMLKVVDGRLEWLQVMRSNDLVRGLPYNFVQWTTIQEVLAGWLDLELGSYVHISDSLHVYDSDSSGFAPLGFEPPKTTSDLRLSLSESDAVFETLERAFLAISGCGSTEQVLSETRYDIPEPYVDWLNVVASERLRRLGDKQLALDVASRVGDAQLRSVTEAWHESKWGGQ